MNLPFDALRTRPSGWSLATRITVAMLLVAALAITGLFWEISRANRAAIERMQTTALHNSASDLARGLDTLIVSEQNRVANLALSRAAQDFVSLRPDQRSALYTPTLADFSNFLASNQPFYRAVLLFDHNGEVLLSTDGSYVGRNMATSAFVRSALRGEVTMSEPGISPLDRQPVVWLAAPVRAAGDDALAGVVAVALSPEEIWQAVEQVTIGDGGYAMVVDGDGIRLAHGRDRRLVFRSLAPLPPERWAALRAEERFASMPAIADTGSTDLLGYLRSTPLPDVWIGAPAAGVSRVYYSAAPLETRPWLAVAMLPEQEVLAPASVATLRGLIATLLVVALLGALVTWMTRRLVRPVPQLAQAAARIAAGDLSVPIAVQGSSELRTLSDNFETMRQRLNQARDELAAWAHTLERRVALRSQELAALSEVVAQSSRGLPEDVLLQAALERALPVMGADMGGVWLAEDDGGLRLAAQSGFSAPLDARLQRMAPGEGVLGQVQQSGAPVALGDVSVRPRLALALGGQQGVHAFAAVPLLVGQRTLGVLGVFSTAQRGFSAEALALATAIGQQIALTLDNTGMVAQLQTQARTVAALHERERIAGEIHDGIAQNLSFIHLRLDAIAEGAADADATTSALLLALQTVLGATISEVRSYITQLHHQAAPPQSLGDQVREDVGKLGRELLLVIELALGDQADLLVPATTATEVRRIVGEALRNAARHGHASHATVALRRENGSYVLQIDDNGSGFDPAVAPADGREHFGLQVMRARAERLGGQLQIRSAPGDGTRVVAMWPADENKHRHAGVGGQERRNGFDTGTDRR